MSQCNLSEVVCKTLHVVVRLREGYLEKNKQPFFEFDNAELTTINNMISMSCQGGFSSFEGV